MFGYFDTELGRIQIAPTIVRTIILQEIQSSKCFSLQGVKTSETVSRKLAEKCIRLNFIEGAVEIILLLSVHYGTQIIKEARELQGKIAKTMQLKAGINVLKVAINVESVFEESAVGHPLLLEQNTIHADAVNQ